MKSETSETTNANRIGFYASLFLSFITIVTFTLAMMAVPIAGPFCPEGCIEYPYLDTLQQYPKDYLWMFPALLMIVTYLIVMGSIHIFATAKTRIFSTISLMFATGSSVLLLMDYFIQFSVIPVSLMNGETQGIALWTQYNPHGLFIAIEEIGYILMSLSLLFVAFVFSAKDRVEKAIRWMLITGFTLTIVSLIYISSKYGIAREYRFEVAAITINWLVFIGLGILLSRVFKREL